MTFETLITFMTIENLRSWQSLLPYNKEWHWTAFAILAMLCYGVMTSWFTRQKCEYATKVGLPKFLAPCYHKICFLLFKIQFNVKPSWHPIPLYLFAMLCLSVSPHADCLGACSTTTDSLLLKFTIKYVIWDQFNTGFNRIYSPLNLRFHSFWVE